MHDAQTTSRILTDGEQLEALKLVRQAVETWVSSRLRILPDAGSNLSHFHSAAFVTLQIDGRLRGCVGKLEPVEPLGHTLVQCAIAAASNDSRFTPVTHEEVTSLHYEISALGPLAVLRSSQDLVVGRDGVMVEVGAQRGLLLPQVAARLGWDAETFLDQACLKAGLAAGQWRREARIWTFQAQVFSDQTLPR